MKYVKCPECGSSLDFGERCDCGRVTPTPSVAPERKEKPPKKRRKSSKRKHIEEWLWK